MNKNELRVANRFLTEEVDESPDDLIQIFYSDLDLPGRKKILDAINDSSEYVDVYGDELTKNKIESSLEKSPLFIIRGGDLMNKIDL